MGAEGEEGGRKNRVKQDGSREERRYGERKAGGETKKYEVKIEILKARHDKRGVGKPRTPRHSPPINDIWRQKYLDYKRSRSQMTWPP